MLLHINGKFTMRFSPRKMSFLIGPHLQFLGYRSRH
jgi:hypothetical protein